MLEFHNAGLFGGVFEAANEFHISLRNWIWFPLMQRSLDNFVYQQNNHRIRRQKEKILPSGGTAEEFYRHPDRYGGEQCGVSVDVPFVKGILDDMLVTNGHLLRVVDDEFTTLADRTYVLIGSPEITEQTAWPVFKVMLQKMSP